MSERGPLDVITMAAAAELIRQARADERERIVQDAEDFVRTTYPVDKRGDGQILPDDIVNYHKWVGAKTLIARIRGGSDGATA